MPMMFCLFSSIAVSKARNAPASIAARRFSSTAAISRSGDLSASAAVVNVISKHIQELSKKSDAILRMRERLRRNTKVLNRLERELRKLYDEIVPDAQVTTPHSDKDKAPLSIVTKQLQYLQDALDFISRTEAVQYRPGVPFDQHQINIISCKPSVVHQLIALRNIFEEVACEIEPPSCFEYELKDDAQVRQVPL